MTQGVMAPGKRGEKHKWMCGSKDGNLSKKKVHMPGLTGGKQKGMRRWAILLCRWRSKTHRPVRAVHSHQVLHQEAVLREARQEGTKERMQEEEGGAS